MAIQLPVYQRQVRETPAQAPRVQAPVASTAQGVDALGRGINQLGAGLGNAALRQEAMDAREAARASGLRLDVTAEKLLAYKESLLNGTGGADGTGTKGFVSTQRGESAITERDSYIESFTSQAKALADKLTPDQRLAFEARARHEITEFTRVVDDHVNRETEALNQQTAKAIVTGKTNEAIQAALRGDIEGIDNAIGAALGYNDEIAARNGLPGPLQDEVNRQTNSTMRLAIIEAALQSGQVEQARDMFEGWGSELDAGMVLQSKLQPRIEAAVATSQATELAADAWAESKNDISKAVETISSTDLPLATKQLAIDYARKSANAYDEQQKKISSDALSFISEDIGRAQGSYTMAELDHNPRITSLNQGDRVKAVNMINAERRRESEDENWRRLQREINERAITDYRARLAENPDKAINADVNGDYSNADQATRNQLREMRAKGAKSVETGDAVKKTEFDGWVRDNLVDSKNAKQAEINKAIRDEMLRWHDDYKNTHDGKDPPRTEAVRKLQDEFLKGKEKGIFRDKERTRIESRVRGNAESWIPPANPPSQTTPVPVERGGRPRVNGTDTVSMTDPKSGKRFQIPRDEVKQAKADGLVEVGK